MEKAAPGITFRAADADGMEYALNCLVRTSREREETEGLAPEADDVVRSRMRYFIDPPRQTGFLSRLLGGPRQLPRGVLIAMDDKGQRVGCLVLGMKQDESQPTAWLYLAFVEPDHRHRGIGRTMMAKAEEWGRANGAGFMMLNVWPSNRVALTLYESTGYETDKVWMRKRL